MIRETEPAKNIHEATRHGRFFAPSGLPAYPTTARPGSREKVLVLIERAAAGVELWHPQDLFSERVRSTSVDRWITLTEVLLAHELEN